MYTISLIFLVHRMMQGAIVNAQKDVISNTRPAKTKGEWRREDFRSLGADFRESWVLGEIPLHHLPFDGDIQSDFGI